MPFIKFENIKRGETGFLYRNGERIAFCRCVHSGLGKRLQITTKMPDWSELPKGVGKRFIGEKFFDEYSINFFRKK